MGRYDEIIRALPRAGQANIVVFGDYCLDKYLYSDPARDEPSVETGLPAFQVHRKAIYAGVGGTITANLRALGAQVRCVGPVGCDGEGYELLAALEKLGASTEYMLKVPAQCTPTYTKPMRKNQDGSYTEQNRLDFRNFSPMDEAAEEALCQKLEAAVEGAEAVVVADQFLEEALGAVTPRVRNFVCRLAQKQPEKVFLADSRAHANRYQNIIIKCNHLEFAAICGMENPEDETVMLQKGKELQKALGKTVFVTRGSRGIWVFGEETGHLPAFPVKGEVDICGAGDATNAALALALSLGLSPAQAATLACCVSSITIQQIGKTGTASSEEVAAVLREAEKI